MSGLAVLAARTVRPDSGTVFFVEVGLAALLIVGLLYLLLTLFRRNRRDDDPPDPPKF